MVKTKSINILNLCVPCYNHCKYCLLSWDGECFGIDYKRSVKYARKFYEWLKVEHEDVDFVYYFGYSMEHPHLLEAVKFMKETNSPGGEFLQFNGIKMRNKKELKVFLQGIKDAGIELINFTFYGTREYHDIFAGRRGDFELMMNSLEIAQELGMGVEVGIPVLKDNINQLEELVCDFSEKNVSPFLFTPHSGGRGIKLLDQKITVKDYEGLSDVVKEHFNRSNNRTPIEWLQDPPLEYKNRALTLSLLPENIDELEKQSFEQTMGDLEKLDEEYYGQVPSFQMLLKQYADENDSHLYSKKDLYYLYRKIYIEENKLGFQNISDERFSGSLRY